MFQEEILEEANCFFEDQQAVTEDANITSDKDESMVLIILVKRYKLEKLLIKFTQSMSFWKDTIRFC